MTIKEYEEELEKLRVEGFSAAQSGKLEKAEELKKKMQDLTAEFELKKKAAADLNAVVAHSSVQNVAKGMIEMGKENNKMMTINDATSVEYKNAYLKNLLGKELTSLENEAFVHTTTNTPGVLPTILADEIWDLVSEQNAILGDVTMYRTGTILEVTRHTEIKKGKGKKTAEGVANDDVENTFTKVTLSGNDFVATVTLSYASALMSLDAFEAYLVSEIASTIGSAMAKDVVDTVTTDIDASNKISATGSLTTDNVMDAFASLKRVGATVVYCTRATLYKQIAKLKDDAGQYIFQASMVPGISGSLLGATIKEEDTVGDGVLLIGDPKKVVYNMVQDIMVESDKDVREHKYIYSGYARGEGTLIDSKAFASITITE